MASSVYTLPFKVDIGHNGGGTLRLHSYDSLSHVYCDEAGRLTVPGNLSSNDEHRILRVDAPRTIKNVMLASGREPSDRFLAKLHPARTYLAEIGGSIVGVGVTERPNTTDGVPHNIEYVTKAGVIIPWQGQGVVGNVILESILNDGPKILRTRRDGLANIFYLKLKPYVHVEKGPWSVYWWGVEDPGSALEEVLANEVTLLGPGTFPLSARDIGVQPVLL